MSRFYVTTPIYYVNDVPHIGHAYTTIAADVLARYHRLRGDDTFFLTGLDEHGQKVQQAAAKAGIDPKTYCDSMVPRFRKLWERLNISNDAFIRTTDAEHKAIVQRHLRQLSVTKDDSGKSLIYPRDYTGWYCTFDERFWTEKDVINGLCPDCKRPVERLSESNYFFRMSKFQDDLLKHLKAHSGLADTPTAFIRPPSRFNEVLSFLEKQPLEDLSISRPKSRLSWGIELPFDPNYVTYVWFDALVNYISALEYLTPNGTTKYWPSDDGQPKTVIHLVGKDILTTHAVYWSTMLMALGLRLPTTIYAHGWWTVDGEKMSKSRGNVVDPNAIVDEFGADAFRYFLLREVPFGHDGDFSREALIGRINSDLANGLGNLLSRTLTMVERFAQGRIPERGTPQLEQTESDIKDEVEVWPQTADSILGGLLFRENLESIWYIMTLCDLLIEETRPWNLARKAESRPRLNNVLNTLSKALRCLCIFIHPYMPTTAQEVSRQLGLSLDFSQPLLASGIDWDGLSTGVSVQKGAALFPRIETMVTTQGEPGVSENPTSPQPSTCASPQPAVPAAAPQITIEDFQKVQLMVARVLTAERVPKSEKLLKLQVDLGGEQRQIVAGIGKRYEPETLVGRRIVVVANLKPAKLMGIESQGMVLAAGDKEVAGLVTLLEEVEPGTKVK